MQGWSKERYSQRVNFRIKKSGLLMAEPALSKIKVGLLAFFTGIYFINNVFVILENNPFLCLLCGG